MKHYKDSNNNLFGFDIDDTVPSGLIEISMEEVAAINQLKAKAAFDALPYDQKRARTYPSITDQLDTIYHEGIDAWKATIAAVKTVYPKV